MKKKPYKSLQKTILSITIIFTIVIGVIIASISAYFYSYYTKKSILQTTDANLNFLVDSINQNISNANRLVAFCQTHSMIGDYMTYNEFSDSQTAIKAFDRLNDEYRLNPANAYIHRIVVANNYGKYIHICDPSYSTSNDLAQITTSLNQYSLQIDKKGYDYSYGYINDPYISRYGKKVLILIQPITYNYSFVRGGYVSLSVNTSLFTDPLKYYSLPDGASLYLTLGEHTYLMTDSELTEIKSFPSSTIDTSIDLSSSTFATSFKDIESNRKSYAVTKNLKPENCYISQVIPQSLINSTKFILFGSFILCFSLIVIITAVLFYILNKVINVPVVKIIKQLDKISNGDFTKDSSIEWNHELGDIGRGINELACNIDSLLAAKIKDEKDKKDLEYKMLQSQINPHFLYNTLNSIKWMAITQGATGISEMTTALSRLLRSISKGTKVLIPLKDELELVKDYYTIQQYRYGATISMEITVDDDSLYYAQIIKFTMQPIVENAIFHGIEPKHTTGLINIHAYYEDEDKSIVAICIEDDGVGMTKEQINSLFEDNQNDSCQLFKEIGINNIQKRIQYEYGDEYGIRVESELNKYTRMIIRIPRRDDYVQAIDS